MKKAFFRVIIPNYNNSKWLDNSLGSVVAQSFRDWFCYFVDDCSDDDSVEKAKKIMQECDTTIMRADSKLWNGGARNVGICQDRESEYTLFLDSDDWFVSPDIFERLHRFIVSNNFPDCVRLPYICRIGANDQPVILTDNTPQGLAPSCFVACWTKCVRSDILVKFPENTLMEDVVQHIAQCDALRQVVPFPDPVVVWNRNNANSCSRTENQNCQQGKWQSSMYRYMADLLDLSLVHDYSIKERNKRAAACLKNIKADRYIQ